MLPVGVPHRRVKNTRLEQEKRSLGKQNLVGAGVEPLPQHVEKRVAPPLAGQASHEGLPTRNRFPHYYLFILTTVFSIVYRG